MKNPRSKNIPPNGIGGHRRGPRVEPSLHAANLGSPIFVESWNGGSPLNWVEFMGRWEINRADPKAPKREE